MTMEKEKKQPEVIDVELSDILGESSGMGFEMVDTTKTKDTDNKEKKD